MTAARSVQVKRFRRSSSCATLAALRARIARPARRRRSPSPMPSTPDGPLAHAVRVRRRLRRHAHRRQPLRGAAHGGVGRQPDGRPTDLVRRRWRRFGESGAKLVWGGEAVAVRPRRARQPAPARARRDVAPSPTLARRLVGAHVHAPGARRSGRRPPAHALRALVPPDGALAAAHRVPPSGARPPRRRRRDASVLTDDELDELVDDLRRRGACSRPTRASTSSTSSTATATCSTSCSARVDRPGRVRRRLRRRTAFLRTVVAASAAAPWPRDRRCGCRASTSCRTSAGADGVGVPDDAATAVRATRSVATDRRGDRPHRGPRASSSCCRELGIGLVVHHRGQPVLQPARPAAGVLPAVGRLPARPRIRWSASPARSTATAALAARAPRAHDRRRAATRTCRSGSRTSPRRSSHAAARRSVGIGRMVLSLPRARRPTSSRAGRSTPRRCAGRSATARPRPATGSSRAATRSTPSTSRARNGWSSPAPRRRPRPAGDG